MSQSAQTNKHAILFMIGAIALFASMDAAAKELTTYVHPVQAIWARYFSATMLVLVIVLPKMKTVFRTQYPRMQAVRSMLVLGATSFFFVSISQIGLAEATAVMDINPVLLTLGGFLFLGEKIGPRRLFGIVMSLIGAIIVIRPGMGVFSVYSILPLAAAVCLTGYNLITRFVGRNENPWTSLFYTALFGAVLLSAIVPFFWTPLTGYTAGLIVLIGVLGTASQWMLIRALTLGEAGLLAPFVYVGLLFATFWGYVIFGDVPDMPTIVGALIIVGSGLYVWYREIQTTPKGR